MANSRKIVFSVPELIPEGAAAGSDGPGAPAAAPEQRSAPEAGDVRKLAMLMEVSEALTGTLNLSAGLYGVLEVLKRRCGAIRGAITLFEPESGLLAVEASLGYPPAERRVP